jgi:hypothetical protein
LIAVEDVGAVEDAVEDAVEGDKIALANYNKAIAIA